MINLQQHLNERQAAALAIVREKPGVESAEVGRRLGLRVEDARRALEDLYGRRLVRRTQDPRSVARHYVWTAEVMP